LHCRQACVYYTHVYFLARFPNKWRPVAMLAELAVEEVAAVLYAVVLDLLEAACVAGPPVDALALARALSVTVAEDDGQQGRARFVRLKRRGVAPPRATILLKPEPRPERRQWAVAHEIGEHAAVRVFERLRVDPREAGPIAREQTANHLASRLLLPTAWLADDGPACFWDLFWLKSRYPTASHELIARRMLDFAPPIVITIYDNARQTLRRSNLTGRVPPMSFEEIACRQAAHDTGQPGQMFASTHSVHAWPIHEETWKREILRTEVEGF